MTFRWELCGKGWVLGMAFLIGCARDEPKVVAETGPDPELAKLVSNSASGGSPTSVADSTPKEKVEPMIVPPPPPEATERKASVQVVNFAQFDEKRRAYQGKYFVVDGWATWCGICKEKFPYFLELERGYRNRNDVVFASIANDPADKEEDVKAFLKESKAELATFVLDEDPADFAAHFEVNGVPAYFIFDPEGKLVFRSGKLDELSEKLKELLK